MVGVREISSLVRVAVLVAGLASALLLRLALAGAGADSSVPAGLAFALVLLLLSLAAGWRPRPLAWRPLAVGVGGAAILCLPPALRVLNGLSTGSTVWQGYPTWALVVAIVAASEELLFRGALYTLVAEIGGEVAAVVVGALLFAAMHVFLNGGRAFALDAAVGVWLGVLRMTSGSVAAPVAAHVLADLAAWWLR